MLDAKQILMCFIDISFVLIKTLVLSIILVYFWANIFMNMYIDISSQICNEYSNITKKQVKYFDAVGCFENIDNNWVKVD